ncbi:helix-turn-helix domain-containing protein [Pseudoclavibacter sp. CFCC 13796]|uniref:helix-turn-helix transcriptional regulator n=1 Tax=unclassified Pseudoclavibacter TaxID=2615177 RepID=UPI0013015BC8|nr:MULTISPECIES: helix-turn-helix domain-containing protein [unclassified Pseudoclavibacter]KAB1661536.1 helix-turn-helix domain-containing protein [Pseudoclavibacter sp. CFCC 13796]MCD7100584.1 helix-turn-helix domain-containing protein [Pseudoclavibacter sp. 13-3]
MTPQHAASPSLLTIKDLARYLSVSEKTIRNLRSKGEGPRAVKIGGSVRWRQETVDQYLLEMEGNSPDQKAA